MLPCEANPTYQLRQLSKDAYAKTQVWVRPAEAHCPKKSRETHYHRPGTGDAVWLTMADLETDDVLEPLRTKIYYPDTTDPKFNIGAPEGSASEKAAAAAKESGKALCFQ